MLQGRFLSSLLGQVNNPPMKRRSKEGRDAENRRTDKHQTLVNGGSDSTFVNEANSTRSSLKLRQSQIIKSMVRTQVTRALGKA